MAKKCMIVANERRKKMVAANKSRRDELRKKSKNIHLSYEERAEAITRLARMPRDSSPTRVRNRCLITGRPRGVLSKRFMLSRIQFRQMALNGELPGVIKASW